MKETAEKHRAAAAAGLSSTPSRTLFDFGNFIEVRGRSQFINIKIIYIKMHASHIHLLATPNTKLCRRLCEQPGTRPKRSDIREFG